jgi:hypothetical protein
MSTVMCKLRNLKIVGRDKNVIMHYEEFRKTKHEMILRESLVVTSPLCLIYTHEEKDRVSQNTTVIFGGAFLFRLKTTCFGPCTGPSLGLK